VLESKRIDDSTSVLMWILLNQKGGGKANGSNRLQARQRMHREHTPPAGEREWLLQDFFRNRPLDGAAAI
jgi:hypothetical protein